MPVSKAHMNATQRYEQKAYDKVLLRLKKGERDEIATHAGNKGDKSLNAFINRAIRETMERDNAQS